MSDLVGDMKQLLSLAFGFTIGYLVVMKAAPSVQAKIEAMDLDEMWDVFAEEWGE